MFGSEQHPPDIDTHEAFFGQDIAPKLMRVEPVRRLYFALALETVHNLEYCNQSIFNAGRPDLVITNPADMVDIPTPAFMGPADTNNSGLLDNPNNLYKGNNYLNNFRLLGQDDIHRKIMDVKSGSNNIRPSFLLPEVKPSTQRMLIIPELSEFTEELIRDMNSDRDILNLKHHHDQRLFIAYQIQRKLVDAADPGVMRQDGSIETRHLIM
jgi:hypothetical protein